MLAIWTKIGSLSEAIDISDTEDIADSDIPGSVLPYLGMVNE